MIEFLQKYWMEVICTGIVGIIGCAYKYSIGKILEETRQKIDKYEKVSIGVQDLLFDRLRQSYNFYMKQGYVVIDDFNCFNRLYESYHSLGGNGAGTEMIARLKDLPPNPPKVETSVT